MNQKKTHTHNQKGFLAKYLTEDNNNERGRRANSTTKDE